MRTDFHFFIFNFKDNLRLKFGILFFLEKKIEKNYTGRAESDLF